MRGHGHVVPVYSFFFPIIFAILNFQLSSRMSMWEGTLKCIHLKVKAATLNLTILVDPNHDIHNNVEILTSSMTDTAKVTYVTQ